MFFKKFTVKLFYCIFEQINASLVKSHENGPQTER